MEDIKDFRQKSIGYLAVVTYLTSNTYTLRGPDKFSRGLPRAVIRLKEAKFQNCVFLVSLHYSKSFTSEFWLTKTENRI